MGDDCEMSPQGTDASELYELSSIASSLEQLGHRVTALAEAALAVDPTEQNFARLLDIKTSLADLASAEAAVDGFGEISGRKSPPV